MNSIPRVYLVSRGSQQLSLDRLIQSAKKVNFEIEARSRDTSIATSNESTYYSHDTPTFFVIDCSEVGKNTIKKIATGQQNSALDQMFTKTLMYQPRIILVTKLKNYLELNYKDFEGIITSAPTIEEAVIEIKKILDERTKLIKKYG